jgi:hypothetical protein
MAVTYYVNSTEGDDHADGTSESEAWRTLGKVGASSFEPGDRILLKRGQTWSGEHLTVPSSGASGRPIVFGAYGSGPAPVIDAAGLSPWCVSGESRSHVTIEDLACSGWTDVGIQDSDGSGWTIQRCTVENGGNDAAPDYGIRVQRRGQVSLLTGIVIRGNTIGRINTRRDDGPGRAGIVAQGLAGAVLSENHVSTRHTPGIRVMDTVRMTVERNDIHGCYGEHLAILNTDGADVRYNTVRQGRGSGITFSSGSDRAAAAYNLIHDIPKGTTLASNGINVVEGSREGEAYNNVVYRVHGSGLLLSRSDGWQIRNNILDASANTGAMIPFSVREAVYSADHNILHPRQKGGPNRMTSDATATQLAAASFGVQTLQYPVVLTPGTPYTFRFQAFSDGSGRAQVAILHENMYLQDDGSWSTTRNWDLAPLRVRAADTEWVRKELTFFASSGTDYTIRFENLRNTGDVFLDSFEIFMSAGIAVDSNGRPRSLAAHQRLDGQNAASLTRAPLFSDPARGDFHLQRGSPALSAGESVGLARDFDGVAVSARPAIGAYEGPQDAKGVNQP